MTSATTQPVFDPNNMLHWHNVLQNAARVPRTDPEYANAQAVVQQALGAIGDLNASANAKEGQPGLLPAAAVAFGQGASLGAASKIGDALNKQNLIGGAIPVTTGSRGGIAQPRPGIYPGADTQTNSAYLSAARAAHPVATTAADLAGSAVLGGALSPVVAGLTPTQAAVVLGGGMGAARGVIEPLTGLTRGETAALYGTTGAVSGYVVGKVVSKLLPIVRQVATNVRGVFGKAPPENLAEISEQAIRARLRQLNVNPEMIERTIESWKIGKAVRTPITRPIEMPVAARPGETLRPIAGQSRGFEVTGTRATPPVPTAPTILEMQTGVSSHVGMPDIGQGKTMPYYPRGGKVEQAFGPSPVTSPPVAGAVDPQAQMAVIQQYLRSLSPEQLPDAIAGVQALGIPLGGTPEQIMALLLGGR